ncbi:MAG: flagellar hook assembly protein FlgD [Spirochaetes bacterium]|nr:flagellar hook assembly protein FlgD [Spirochaetota bacterium]
MKAAKMTAEEMMAAKLEAEIINKKVNHGRVGNKGGLDKDAFMKLLITELRYQDPTRPMEDREFIAQMAQFSTLEQMSNMNKEISGLVRSSRSSEAFSLLGKHIEALDSVTGRRVSGVVTSIQYNGDEQLLVVGSQKVKFSDIHSVRVPEPAETAIAGGATAPDPAASSAVRRALQNASIMQNNQSNSMDAVQSK